MNGIRGLMRIVLCSGSALLLPGQVSGDNPGASGTPRTNPAKPRVIEHPAHISGTVTNASGEPLRRARVTLTPQSTLYTPKVVETDERGAYSFGLLEPGVFSLQAQRDGYLPAEFGIRGGIRMPRQFGLYPDERWSDVTLRLERWAVISGRIKYGDDAEAAMRVPVQAFRKRFVHGRLEYQLASSTRSDDRGDYRLPGLAPGAYIVAAIYDKPRRPSTTSSEALTAEELAEAITEAPATEPSYSSVFFTSATRVTDAAPLELSAGQEQTNVDLFLAEGKSTRIRGRITDGCTGLPAAPSLNVFRAAEDEAAAIPANAEVNTSSNGAFVIRGLAPGVYVLTALLTPTKDCPARSYRRTFFVSEEPFDDVEVMLTPYQRTDVRWSYDGQSKDLPRYRVQLYPRIRRGAPIPLQVSSRARAEVLLDPNETYTVVLEEGPADHFLQGPLEVSGNVGLIHVQIRTRGAKLAAAILTEDKKPVPGAAVTLIPEQQNRLPQPFPESYADLDGGAFVRGIPPGRYLAVPWLDKAPCDLHAPDAYRACGVYGTSVGLVEGEEKVIGLKLSFR